MLLYVMFWFSTSIFYRRVPGFATDCPCGVWCRGLTTCLLYVGPRFGKKIVWNDSGFAILTSQKINFSVFLLFVACIIMPHNMIVFHLPYFYVSHSALILHDTLLLSFDIDTVSTFSVVMYTVYIYLRKTWLNPYCNLTNLLPRWFATLILR